HGLGRFARRRTGDLLAKTGLVGVEIALDLLRRQRAAVNADEGDESGQGELPVVVKFALEKRFSIGAVFGCDVHVIVGSGDESVFVGAAFGGVVVDLRGLAVVGVHEVMPFSGYGSRAVAPAHVLVIMGDGVEAATGTVVERKIGERSAPMPPGNH